MLVTLLHNNADNRAEAIVTKCLESALDVQYNAPSWLASRCRSSASCYLLQQLCGKRETSRNKIPYIIAEFWVGYCLVLRKAKRETEGETAYWLLRYRTVCCITSKVQHKRFLLSAILIGKIKHTYLLPLSWLPNFYLPSIQLPILFILLSIFLLVFFLFPVIIPFLTVGITYLPALSVVFLFLLYSS
jgi:hypothetical protein